MVRGWEQGRRQPPSAKVLMRVATKYPKQVLDQLLKKLIDEGYLLSSVVARDFPQAFFFLEG